WISIVVPLFVGARVGGGVSTCAEVAGLARFALWRVVAFAGCDLDRSTWARVQRQARTCVIRGGGKPIHAGRALLVLGGAARLVYELARFARRPVFALVGVGLVSERARCAAFTLTVRFGTALFRHTCSR